MSRPHPKESSWTDLDWGLGLGKFWASLDYPTGKPYMAGAMWGPPHLPMLHPGEDLLLLLRGSFRSRQLWKL